MGEKEHGSGQSDVEAEPPSGHEDASGRLYRALSAAARRRLLWYMLDDTEEVTLDEAARVLAGWEATETGTLSTEADHDDLLVELHHRHLPVLDEAGLVSYDPNEKAVVLESLDESTAERLEDLVGVNDDDGR